MSKSPVNRRNALKLGLAATATALAAPQAFSQGSFPNRPIKLVVPFSAGGVNDIIGRHWAERVKPALGSVYVENVGGAGGTLGVMEVKRADPDGHTIALGSTSTMVLNTMTMSNVGYDPNRDFVPIAIFTVSITSIAVHPSVPAKNVKELVAVARAKPRGISFASTGVGSNFHLAGELLKITAKVDMLHVAYRGSPQAVLDLVAGRVDSMFVHVPTVKGYIDSGRLKPLATTGTARNPLLPNVPTIAESGMKSYEVAGIEGVFAPAGTPRAVVDRLNAEFIKASEAPKVKEIYATNAAEAMKLTPAQVQAAMERDAKAWAEVVKATGVQLN